MAEHQPRRRWIKLWTQETLHGTTCKELEPDERTVWFESLCAAGDSVVPGKICISETMGYTDQQLADLFKVSPELLQRALGKLESDTVNKIKRNHNGIIEIINWERYQSDERRMYMAKYMRDYRRQKKQRGKVDK